MILRAPKNPTSEATKPGRFHCRCITAVAYCGGQKRPKFSGDVGRVGEHGEFFVGSKNMLFFYRFWIWGVHCPHNTYITNYVIMDQE